MAALQGKLVMIQVGDAGSEKTLLGTLSHSSKFNQELQDATTKDSTGGWDEVIPSTRNASFDVTGVYDPETTTGQGAEDMLDLLSDGTKTHLIFGHISTGSKVKECDAYVESLSEDAPLKDRTTFSVTFKATGLVTTSTVT